MSADTAILQIVTLSITPVETEGVSAHGIAVQQVRCAAAQPANQHLVIPTPDAAVTAVNQVCVMGINHVMTRTRTGRQNLAAQQAEKSATPVGTHPMRPAVLRVAVSVSMRWLRVWATGVSMIPVLCRSVKNVITVGVIP